MGGQNHQPCGRYLHNSTRLSRQISVARAAVELANIELEDVLLADMEGHRGTLSKVVLNLQGSANALSEAIDIMGRLAAQMRALEYEDLPSLRVTNLEDLGKTLAVNQLVSQQSWSRVSSMMLRGGFWLVLDHFRSSAAELINATSDLVRAVELAEDSARSGELNLVLEENRLGNLKVEFAKLYTNWALMQQDFLASSLLSTELWYAFTGREPLLLRNHSGKRAA